MFGLALNVATGNYCLLGLSFTERVPEGLRYYLQVLPVTLVLVLLVSFVYATLTKTVFFEDFRWVLLGMVFLMFLVGFGSLLPFSEYHYGPGDVFSPHARKEHAKAAMKERESKAGALAFVLVGVTLFLIYFALFPY